MGLFDKRKKSDDFDSPVEKIDLSAPMPEPARDPEPSLAAPEPDPEPDPEPEYEPEPEPEPDPPPYGIDDAIQLMRALPGDNVELVVQVVKRTLESTKVQVRTIIDDATRKQDTISARIDVLKKEIASYEHEIATRKDEIGGLEADHKETTTVKERLQLAEKLTSGPAKPAGRPTGAAGTIGGASASPSMPSSGVPKPMPSTPSGKTTTTVKGTTIVAKK